MWNSTCDSCGPSMQEYANPRRCPIQCASLFQVKPGCARRMHVFIPQGLKDRAPTKALTLNAYVQVFLWHTFQRLFASLSIPQECPCFLEIGLVVVETLRDLLVMVAFQGSFESKRSFLRGVRQGGPKLPLCMPRDCGKMRFIHCLAIHKGKGKRHSTCTWLQPP